MLKRWRRLRIAVTILFGLIGGGLLYLAWIAPPAVNGEARGVLGCIGVVLPIGFYAVFTVAGWARSTGTGIAPPAPIAWLLRRGLAPMFPVFFLFALLGLAWQLDTALERPGFGLDEGGPATQNFNFLNRSCVAELGRSIRAGGHDPDSAERKPRIEKYCRCFATQVPLQFSVEVFRQVVAHTATAEQTQKFDRLTAQCERESNG